MIPDKNLIPQSNTPDTNATTPISPEGNTTQSQGKENVSKVSWITVSDSNGTVEDYAHNCN